MTGSSPVSKQTAFRGWNAVWGCSYQALAIYRVALGGILVLELVLRFRFLHPFYSDEGTLPLELLLPKVDSTYQWVCLHCHFGSILEQQVLLSVQVLFAILFTLGVMPTMSAAISWYLYLSLTLRNTWMNYILDRYFHYLLLHAVFFPTSKREAQDKFTVTPATISLKILLVWIYLDAGGGKLLDPLGGWSYSAQPLPALDTYTRHTTVARYVYSLLGPEGLRIMTPVVVWVELLAAPVAMIGAYMGNQAITWISIVLICSLHVGIALCMSNAALLSFVACVPWSSFLPLGWNNKASTTEGRRSRILALTWKNVLSAVCLFSMMVGSVWIDAFGAACDQSVRHIWSTLLHNRWNVFVGAEEYVTWEIAPGLLEDGKVVDVWARSEEVIWSMPGAGAPCTSTSRPGRWRSFPYLAELKGEDGEALWGYLCDEWNRAHPDQKLLRYNFFMLQADVLPNMTFSATRKRLIHTQECFPTSSVEGNDTDSTSLFHEEL